MAVRVVEIDADPVELAPLSADSSAHASIALPSTLCWRSQMPWSLRTLPGTPNSSSSIWSERCFMAADTGL